MQQRRSKSFIRKRFWKSVSVVDDWSDWHSLFTEAEVLMCKSGCASIVRSRSTSADIRRVCTVRRWRDNSRTIKSGTRAWSACRVDRMSYTYALESSSSTKRMRCRSVAGARSRFRQHLSDCCALRPSARHTAHQARAARSSLGLPLRQRLGTEGAISDVRMVLEDDPQRPRFVETVPRRGYRGPRGVCLLTETGVGYRLSDE